MDKFFIVISVVIVATTLTNREFWDFGGIFALLAYVIAIFIKDAVNKNTSKYRLPPHAEKYLIFLFLLAVSFIWSLDTKLELLYFSYFVSGFLFWLISYNSNIIFKNFYNLVVVIGVFYGILTLIYVLTGDPAKISPLSLIKYSVAPLHHHHIADLWSIVLIVCALLITKGKKIYWFLMPVGFYFLVLGLSRSSYVALMSGSVYVLWRGQLKYRFKYLFVFLIIASIALFIYASNKKSTLYAHSAYIVQGIVGTAKNPFGVGLGNFSLLSNNPNYDFLKSKVGSSSAHNIILEVVSGLGVFSVSFLYWLYLTFKDVFKRQKKYKSMNAEKLIYRAVFLTIFVNFLFDYTYFIPVMFWLWFVSLGLAQKSGSVKLKSES